MTPFSLLPLDSCTCESWLLETQHHIVDADSTHIHPFEELCFSPANYCHPAGTVIVSSKGIVPFIDPAFSKWWGTRKTNESCEQKTIASLLWPSSVLLRHNVIWTTKITDSSQPVFFSYTIIAQCAHEQNGHGGRDEIYARVQQNGPLLNKDDLGIAPMNAHYASSRDQYQCPSMASFLGMISLWPCGRLIILDCFYHGKDGALSIPYWNKHLFTNGFAFMHVIFQPKPPFVQKCFLHAGELKGPIKGWSPGVHCKVLLELYEEVKQSELDGWQDSIERLKNLCWKLGGRCPKVMVKTGAPPKNEKWDFLVFPCLFQSVTPRTVLNQSAGHVLLKLTQQLAITSIKYTSLWNLLVCSKNFMCIFKFSLWWRKQTYTKVLALFSKCYDKGISSGRWCTTK